MRQEPSNEQADAQRILNDAQDRADLKRAVALLETPSITARMAALAGAPIEFGMSKLPNFAHSRIQKTVHSALHKAASAALWTVKDVPSKGSSTKTHKLAAAVSGAAGGLFGIAGLAVELPVTTVIMMRSVADIARSEGFSVSDPWVQAACVEVFAFGGNSKDDDASESGYYASRGVLSELTKNATKELVHIVGHRGAEQVTHAYAKKQAASWLAKLIDAVATRFGVIITEKTAAQIVPVLGAATAATMNVLFTNHYQDMARGHFIVKRLEQKYGAEPVERAYRELKSGVPALVPGKVDGTA
ncbi:MULTISPECIES: EcsC family protein [Lysobacter]|uniref:EcsC family protein n=1 Tax=Lysobacter gummosus TaxID=262324 RepID=A0ABY3X9V4_9GAMM|nr:MULTISPECIES: EcsC family protein [Lysobacter]UJB19510.1 EcsC family protein [Lysobacter capsici]UJQ26764.1 EcsC family protein [Lysobacter gummosus]UNP29373.1 EcsC family protein [Lysobacter gummosus]